MAVKLRLTRVGSKKNPIYRVVAADARAPRDGKFLDIVGRDLQDKDERALALLLLHANRLRIVDELAREVREQL